MNGRLLLFILILLCNACSSEQLLSETDNGDEPEPQPTSVLVYKYQGGVQCDEDSGISLEEMEADLTDVGIEVLCSAVSHDIYGYPTVCGGAHGMINVYEISEEDLIQAENLGFMNLAEMTGATVEMGCE